jgi:hypothetical protein
MKMKRQLPASAPDQAKKNIPERYLSIYFFSEAAIIVSCFEQACRIICPLSFSSGEYCFKPLNYCSFQGRRELWQHIYYIVLKGIIKRLNIFL